MANILKIREILGNLLEQVYQMKSLFDDADGAIRRAIEDAENALIPFEVGAKVLWRDPENRAVSPGRITHIQGMEEEGVCASDAVISLKMDDGGEVEALPHELTLISPASSDEVTASSLLKQLADQLSETEDLEHDHFGCPPDQKCALCLAKDFLAKEEGTTTVKPNLAIIVEGGSFQCAVSDHPEMFSDFNLMVVDYDVDTANPDDTRLGLIQDGTKLEPAYICPMEVEKAVIDLGQIADFCSGQAYGSSRQRYAACRDYPCEGCPDVNTDGNRCVNEEKCLAWKFYQNGTAGETEPIQCDGCPEPDGEPPCRTVHCLFHPHKK